MKKFTILFSLLFVLCISVIELNAQISKGGTPMSMQLVLDNAQIPVVSLEAPDMKVIEAEDEANVQSEFPGPERMAVSLVTDITPATHGKWTTIPNGGRMWQLSIESEGAKALGLYYDNVYIPEGAELFAWNEAQDQIIGAFTHDNNPAEGKWANEFIQGDVVTIEYYEPAGTTEELTLEINEVAYAYRWVDFLFAPDRGSLPCMINIACEEGDDWTTERQGVARMSIKIGFGYYWCSGSLINNTEHDRTPYFLSAAHCGEGSSVSDRNQWVFYFNYASANCYGGGAGYNSLTGCELKAHDPSYGGVGSDFYLVELNQTPPDAYDPYYNGWDRTNNGSPNGVCIHHPAGDVMKISTYLIPLVSSTFWTGNSSHWRLIWGQTLNGKSIVEGGSSGSALFSEEKLIVGDLSGGLVSNSCANPSPAWYGKVWWSWDKCGSASQFRLKDWLDPNTLGYEKIEGIGWEVLPPAVDFEADTTQTVNNDTVNFTDISGGWAGTEWLWTFEGGTPETSTEQHPQNITWAAVGTYDVTLVVTNPDGIDSLTKEDYITVLQAAPVADFEASNLMPGPDEQINFTDMTANDPVEWTWTFEGGTPETSTDQNPEGVSFTESGHHDVQLIVSNDGGADTLLKEDYIYVFWVGVDESAMEQVKIYPNPSNGIFSIDISSLSELNKLEVIDMRGNVVSSFENMQDQVLKVNIQDQAEGIYYIRFHFEKGTASRKINLAK